jgi:acylphosphatase
MFARATILLGILALPDPAPEGKGRLEVDRAAGVVIVPATVATQGRYDVLKGAIEYVLVSRDGKDYESLFITEVPPQELHAAFIDIGLEPGTPAGGGSLPQGPPVRILVDYEQGGKRVRRPAEEFVLQARTGQPLAALPWTYTGSVKAFDPETRKEVSQCLLTKSIVGLHFIDASALFQNARAEAARENIYKARADQLPPAGTSVKLVFEQVRRQVPDGTRRVRAAISGRLEGVGFEVFAQGRARALGLTGRLRREGEGAFEALIEGPSENVDRLLADLRARPRAARVDRVDARDEPARGDRQDFRLEP